MGQPSSPRKILRETLRRGWLVLVTVALVSLVAWGVGKALKRSYNAEAVLVVLAGGPLASQPDASTKLAATYATLIPLDSGVENAIEGVVSSANSSFTASNDANTALLRVTYKAPSAAEAVAGAHVVARAISGAKPASTSIAPNSVALVRLPSSAVRSGSTPGQLAAVGAALGLLLGIVLVAFWRARDARIDDARELRRLVRCPCFEVDLGTTTGMRPLIECLASAGERTVVVLPCREQDEPAAESLRETLSGALGVGVTLRANSAGSNEGSELVPVAAADTTILVASRGVRVTALGEALDLLGRYGVAPGYAVMTGKRVSCHTPGLVLGDKEGVSATHPAS